MVLFILSKNMAVGSMPVVKRAKKVKIVEKYEI
jgi:hypothetical protein